ncbi:MAG: inositol monophosphatase family protein [Patescibacteria group bacterium]|nr:inositol monophosphatase family protein [Patescibacteria group bacterium]
MEEINLLKKAVKKAGRVALNYYHSKNIIHEDGYTPLTKADFASEKVLISELKKTPYKILSEHQDNKERLKENKIWIIDPLDGTKDFIQKTGEFSIMAALTQNNKPIIGAIYQPVTKKLYYAQKDKGAFLKQGRNKPIKLSVSNNTDFTDMSLLVSRNHLLPGEIKLCENLKIGKKIPYGSAGLKAALICEQKADIYLNSSDQTGEWDIGAAEIIFKEAGGKITDMLGHDLKYNKKKPINKQGFVLSHKLVHKKIISELKKINE